MPDIMDRKKAPFSVLILAAGMSVRFGAPKLIQPIGGTPLLQRVINEAMLSDAMDTILVVGHEWDRLLMHVDTHYARVVINPNYSKGMANSLQAGIKAVPPEFLGCVVAMGDQPFVGRRLINSLMKKFLRVRPLAVMTEYDGVKATPVLLSRDLFAQVMRLRGDKGAKSLLLRYKDRVSCVSLKNQVGLIDVDTSSDLETARQLLKKKSTSI
jgi:molybdenum cofactor cytidylyltransferase